MRIAQINAVNALSSTGRTTLELAEGLAQRGHECLTLHTTGPSTDGSRRVGSTIDSKIHAALARATGLQSYWSVGITRELLRELDAFGPDIVRLGNLHANFVNLPMLLEYLADRNIPTLLTLHDAWFYTGKCTHYAGVGCDRWRTGCGECPLLKADIPSWLFDRTAKMWADKARLFGDIPRLGVVGVSDWITREAKQSLLSSACFIERIYNWVDLDTFKETPSDTRARYGWGDDFVALSVASGWVPQKGLDDALRLGYELPEGVRLVLVGRLSETTGLPERVHHIDATNSTTELAELYSAADVFLNFSRLESFGKVSAEALACGTPVITNHGTANPELVPDGTGYVAENTDPEVILPLLERIRAAGKQNYSLACRHFAETDFGLKRGVDEYERALLRLLECSRA